MANAAATIDGQDVFWVVCEIGHEQHVIPIGDLRPHTGFDCWCKPTTENDGIWVHIKTTDARRVELEL
jgi:hypothetical protein